MSLYAAVVVHCNNYLENSSKLIRQLLLKTTIDNPLSFLPAIIAKDNELLDNAAAQANVLNLAKVHNVPLINLFQELFDNYMRTLLTDIVEYVNASEDRRITALDIKAKEKSLDQLTSEMMKHTKELAKERENKVKAKQKESYEEIAALQTRVLSLQAECDAWRAESNSSVSETSVPKMIGSTTNVSNSEARNSSQSVVRSSERNFVVACQIRNFFELRAASLSSHSLVSSPGKALSISPAVASQRPTFSVTEFESELKLFQAAWENGAKLSGGVSANDGATGGGFILPNLRLMLFHDAERAFRFCEYVSCVLLRNNLEIGGGGGTKSPLSSGVITPTNSNIMKKNNSGNTTNAANQKSLGESVVQHSSAPISPPSVALTAPMSTTTVPFQLAFSLYESPTPIEIDERSNEAGGASIAAAFRLMQFFDDENERKKVIVESEHEQKSLSFPDATQHLLVTNVSPKDIVRSAVFPNTMLLGSYFVVSPLPNYLALWQCSSPDIGSGGSTMMTPEQIAAAQLRFFSEQPPKDPVTGMTSQTRSLALRNKQVAAVKKEWLPTNSTSWVTVEAVASRAEMRSMKATTEVSRSSSFFPSLRIPMKGVLAVIGVTDYADIHHLSPSLASQTAMEILSCLRKVIFAKSKNPVIEVRSVEAANDEWKNCSNSCRSSTFEATFCFADVADAVISLCEAGNAVERTVQWDNGAIKKLVSAHNKAAASEGQKKSLPVVLKKLPGKAKIISSFAAGEFEFVAIQQQRKKAGSDHDDVESNRKILETSSIQSQPQITQHREVMLTSHELCLQGSVLQRARGYLSLGTGGQLVFGEEVNTAVMQFSHLEQYISRVESPHLADDQRVIVAMQSSHQRERKVNVDEISNQMLTGKKNAVVFNRVTKVPMLKQAAQQRQRLLVERQQKSSATGSENMPAEVSVLQSDTSLSFSMSSRNFESPSGFKASSFPNNMYIYAVTLQLDAIRWLKKTDPNSATLILTSFEEQVLAPVLEILQAGVICYDDQEGMAICVMKDATMAMDFCCEITTRLMQVRWEASILRYAEFATVENPNKYMESRSGGPQQPSSSRSIFHGPRLSIGFHCGRNGLETILQSAHVCDACIPGEIRLSHSAMLEIYSTEYSSLLERCQEMIPTFSPMDDGANKQQPLKESMEATSSKITTTSPIKRRTSSPVSPTRAGCYGKSISAISQADPPKEEEKMRTYEKQVAQEATYRFFPPGLEGRRHALYHGAQSFSYDSIGERGIARRLALADATGAVLPKQLEDRIGKEGDQEFSSPPISSAAAQELLNVVRRQSWVPREYILGLFPPTMTTDSQAISNTTEASNTVSSQTAQSKIDSIMEPMPIVCLNPMSTRCFILTPSTQESLRADAWTNERYALPFTPFNYQRYQSVRAAFEKIVKNVNEEKSKVQKKSVTMHAGGGGWGGRKRSSTFGSGGSFVAGENLEITSPKSPVSTSSAPQLAQQHNSGIEQLISALNVHELHVNVQKALSRFLPRRLHFLPTAPSRYYDNLYEQLQLEQQGEQTTSFLHSKRGDSAVSAPTSATATYRFQDVLEIYFSEESLQPHVLATFHRKYEEIQEHKASEILELFEQREEQKELQEAAANENNKSHPTNQSQDGIATAVGSAQKQSGSVAALSSNFSKLQRAFFTLHSKGLSNLQDSESVDFFFKKTDLRNLDFFRPLGKLQQMECSSGKKKEN